MRIVKFSVVGAIGIVVQLALLAALTHLHLHYLLATICAVEAAVLHNFCWHQRFTWRDRRVRSAWTRLTRFHLSNAAISLVGNVALMRVFVGSFSMKPVVGNLLAVATCAVVNYLASEYWVFAARRSEVIHSWSSHALTCGRSRISTSVRCAKGT
jgi:dolichol-phosphate mannosyltransferase